MRLEIRTMWSADLNPPSEGLPEDPTDYVVYISVAVGEEGQDGTEVFGFTVCSPSRVPSDDGRFITYTLVMRSFSWGGLRGRLEKLLRHAGTPGAATWDEVIRRLKPYLKYADEDD